MSIEQLAAATKIPRRSLEMLEEDRYDALPGPVFVKGFLRCAARALGLDVQTVMDLLYERERASMSRRRERAPSAPSMVAPDEFAPRRSVERSRRTSEPMPEGQDAVGVPAVEPDHSGLADGSDRFVGLADGPEQQTCRGEPRGADASSRLSRPESSAGRRRPARLRARPTAGPNVLDRVRAHLPSPAVFLWVVVAAFVAMVVLAAFNMVGGAGAGGPS